MGFHWFPHCWNRILVYILGADGGVLLGEWEFYSPKFEYWAKRKLLGMSGGYIINFITGLQSGYFVRYYEIARL